MIQKTAEATGHLVGKKTAEKMTKADKEYQIKKRLYHQQKLNIKIVTAYHWSTLIIIIMNIYSGIGKSKDPKFKEQNQQLTLKFKTRKWVEVSHDCNWIYQRGKKKLYFDTRVESLWQ